MTKRFFPLYAAIVLAAGLDAFAQSPPTPQNPPLVIRSLAGRDLFEFYCATCHGRDGRGQGPVAIALKAPPPDLTRLTAHNGGTFPRERVQMFVTHDGSTLSPAHGTAEMPVWGPVFRGLDPSDTLAAIRIANVVQYIESIQERGVDRP